jgi:hypothetical protein
MKSIYAAIDELSRLEQQVMNSGAVAPPGCWIDTYSPAGRDTVYVRKRSECPLWDGKRTQGLGVVGSVDHRDFEAQIKRRNTLQEIKRRAAVLREMNDNPLPVELATDGSNVVQHSLLSGEINATDIAILASDALVDLGEAHHQYLAQSNPNEDSEYKLSGNKASGYKFNTTGIYAPRWGDTSELERMHARYKTKVEAHAAAKEYIQNYNLKSRAADILKATQEMMDNPDQL